MRKPSKNFGKYNETSREGKEWFFRVNIRSLSKNFRKVEPVWKISAT